MNILRRLTRAHRAVSMTLRTGVIAALVLHAPRPLAPGDAPLSARFADCQTPQAPTNSTEAISCTTPRGNTAIWRIDRPNIRQRQTTYPNIRFQQGDLVSVFAGGCAQSGGAGLTWKRYVNPMSPGKNDDDKYHGLISVPGFSTLGHIRDAVLQGGIAILADPGPGASLSLGYADDGYGDNGYTGHDDGWWQQCNDVGNAWVVIAIQHGCAASSSPDCIRGRALDLVADSHDANGFPVNPDWVFRRLTGVSPNAAEVCSWSTKIGGFPVDNAALCVSQSTARDGNGVCVQGGTMGGLAGHLNWVGTPVTYTGWIWWDGHDYYWDDDYTLNVAALDATGHVSGSLFLAGQYNPQVEFQTDETIDQISNVPWWDALHRAANTEDEILHTANAVVTGAVRPADLFPGGIEGIVIGQLGVDCAHSCNSELHPAFGLFIHTKDDVHDDTWAFFVRNWGNEGFCSTEDHRIPAQQITVRLPRLGATGVQQRLPQTVVGMTKPTSPYAVTLAPGGGAALATFNLPPADQHGLVFGELHLDWQRTLSPQMLATLAHRPTPAMMMTQRPHRGAAMKETSAESELTRRLDRLPRARRDSMLVHRPSPPPPPFRRLEGRVTAAPTAPPAPAPAAAIAHTQRVDPRAAQRAAVARRLIPDTTHR